MLIDSASANPQEVPSPDVLPTLASVAATDTAADFPALLARAVDFLHETTASRPEVWIASDLQQTDWAPENERWQSVRSGLSALLRKPTVRVLAVGGTPAPNCSLRVLAARRTGDDLALELEVLRQNDDRESVNLPLTVALDGVRTTESTHHLRRIVPLPTHRQAATRHRRRQRMGDPARRRQSARQRRVLRLRPAQAC